MKIKKISEIHCLKEKQENLWENLTGYSLSPSSCTPERQERDVKCRFVREDESKEHFTVFSLFTIILCEHIVCLVLGINKINNSPKTLCRPNIANAINHHFLFYILVHRESPLDCAARRLNQNPLSSSHFNTAY